MKEITLNILEDDRNIFKLNLKTNNNITETKKIDLGVSLYKIAKYNNLNNNQTKRLIYKWYTKSKFNSSFNEYYNNLLTKVNNNPLTTTEFYKTLNDMNLNQNNYHKQKQKYYIKKYVYNKLLYNALEHIKYENERIKKEIVESMKEELTY